MLIYPAIMGITQEEIAKIELIKHITRRVHIDIMDNIFVPNITHGTERIAEYAHKEKLDVWIHCMVHDIKVFLDDYDIPERSLVSFHFEVCNDILDVINRIKEKKCRASIAISPKTPVEVVVPFCDIVDQILIMSVDPGFSGQPFLPEVISKIEALVMYRQKHQLNFRIGVDGGVNEQNITILADNGVDDVAVSSGIFGEPNPAHALQNLLKITQKR